MPDLPAKGWEVHGVTALRREIISSRQETGERERERKREGIGDECCKLQ